MSINIHQEKLNVYRNVVNYFGDIVLTKGMEIPETFNSSAYSLYYARIGCLLCIDDRYIVVIVEGSEYQINHQSRLSSLNWISFQTRTIEKPPVNLKTQTSKDELNEFMNSRIKLTDKKTDRYIYFTEESPIKIELLFTKNDTMYSEFGTIGSALSTYNCVISFIM